MWRWLMLLGLWLLLDPKSCWALQAVTCSDPMYTDCHHYCNNNCPDLGVDCMLNCENGCGCQEAFVQRNNGGCFKVHECVWEDKTDESPETTATPCVDTVPETTISNGDERLNLLEFSPLDPHG